MAAAPSPVDYQNEPYWSGKRLSPIQLMVHDVKLAPWPGGHHAADSILEMNEVLPSAFAPDSETRDALRSIVHPATLTANRSEQSKLKSLLAEYGWLNCLRSELVQEHVSDPPNLRKCRWM